MTDTYKNQQNHEAFVCRANMPSGIEQCRGTECSAEQKHSFHFLAQAMLPKLSRVVIPYFGQMTLTVMNTDILNIH